MSFPLAIRTPLALAALAAASPALADSVLYSGALTAGGPTFNRPVNGGGSLSANGTAVYYHVQQFTVGASGNYELRSSQTFDGIIFLYQNSFNPASPLVNHIADNDIDHGPFWGGPAGPWTHFSDVPTVALAAGTPYFLVTTTFANGVTGPFANEIMGPGSVTLAGHAAGACCLPDGTCAVLNTLSCDHQSGLYGGDGAPCASVTCFQPPAGACCQLDGSCAIVNSLVCARVAGIYRGDGSGCSGANCPATYIYSGSPVPVPNGTSTSCGGTVFAQINVPDSFTITDVADAAFWMTHPFQGDVVVSLTHVDTGTTVTMLDRPGRTATNTSGYANNNFGNGNEPAAERYFRSVDDAPLRYHSPDIAGPADNITGRWKSQNPLSVFLGQNSAGTWRLQVRDCAFGAGTGVIHRFVLSLGRPAGAAPCYPNCDGSTSVPFLNVADFTCFLQRFAASDPDANCDGSTLAPTLNVADFTCFLQRFSSGCSAP